MLWLRFQLNFQSHSQEGERCSLVTKIGISGTGFIGSGVARLLLNHHPDLPVNSILTRRPVTSLGDMPGASKLTQSLDCMIDSCDLVVECSGDVMHATNVVAAAMLAGKPVVTMNAEFHVTTGSYFVDKGFISEAEGDQPGCLAALREDMLQMGFKPMVYGNMKGYLNHNPTREDMIYWSTKQGISSSQTTSFTDGTKLQIEQVLIGNAVGATIAQQGLIGVRTDDLSHAANELCAVASDLNCPIVDFTLSSKLAPGVFIAGTHDSCQAQALKYYKLGDGPYFSLLRPYHLCAFEVVKTIRRAVNGGPVLLNNGSRPSLSVAAIAKRTLKKGESIASPVGGFMVRGEAIKAADSPDHIPIGILKGATLLRDVEPGHILSWSDVETVDCLATEIAMCLFRRSAIKAA
jgi:predicted homoserine dehydrogenase-like protein